MQLALGIALGLVGTAAAVLAVCAWDLRALCGRQRRELWALREALRLSARGEHRHPV